ncbi:MAG: TATA-box-binding protein [Nanohaloarchaea archaeon SW_4_43_9]|nr:MAG: TATA-box-binding protein [Nanohaloarchaea archaeon SW_4_43_9]
MSEDAFEDENIKIENVVASTTLDRRMPLDRIAIYLENTEYEPEQFPGLVYRLEEPKAAALLFGSGKVVCTGTQSPEMAKDAVHKIIDELREADVEIDRIAFELVGTEYEPEQFPGLVYRIDEPNVVFLLFSSGRIVCTGGRTYDDVRSGISKLKENLEEIGAL